MVAVAGLVVLAPKVVTGGEPSLATPGAPRVSETAGTMLRVSWRPVLFSDFYELTVTHDKKTETLRVEGTEVQVPNLSLGHGLRGEGPGDPAAQGRRPRAQHAVATRRPPAPPTPDKPALLVPANPEVETAGNTSLDIAWDPVETATRYRVQLASDDSFRNPRNITSDGRTATFKGLDAATPFVVRVRALGEDGFKSAWTETIQHRDDQARRPAAADGRHVQRPLRQVRRSAVGQPARRRSPASIASHGLDVVGLQEAQQSKPRGVGISQFHDLMRQLDAREGGWKITDERINGTLGVRIIYNTRAVRLVKAGATHYSNQLSGTSSASASTPGPSSRSARPARTSCSSTPTSNPARCRSASRRRASWPPTRHGCAASCPRSSSATSTPRSTTCTARTRRSRGPATSIRSASCRRRTSRREDATVEKRINTHLDSFNNFGSRPSGSVSHRLNGTYIDYIFSTPMRVLEYENVVDLDASGRFRGGAPSDHNMLRAVVGLP